VDGVVSEPLKWGSGEQADDITVIALKAENPYLWREQMAQLQPNQFSKSPDLIPLLLRGTRRYELVKDNGHESLEVKIGRDEKNDKARIGAWWSRTEEIDVVALSDDSSQVLAGECKWTQKPVGTNILDELKAKAQILTKQSPIGRTHYALQSVADAEGILLFTLENFKEIG